MVRKKNVGDTVMTSFAITCLVTVHLRGPHLLAGVHRRHAVHRRPEPRVPARHPQRRQQRRHRQPEPARADDPRDRLHVLPDDLRDHHARADRRRVRGAHEVLGHAVVHRPVGDLRLRAGRALAVGTRRHLQLRQRRRPGSRFSTSPAARSCTSTRASRVSIAAIMVGKRRDTRPRPQHGPDLHRRGPAVGRLVRLQRGLRGQRGRAGRHGDDRHPDRHRGRGADLDVRRVGPSRQADRHRHRLGRGRRPRRHHARPRASSVRSARS